MCTTIRADNSWPVVAPKHMGHWRGKVRLGEAKNPKPKIAEFLPLFFVLTEGGGGKGADGASDGEGGGGKCQPMHALF